MQLGYDHLGGSLLHHLGNPNQSGEHMMQQPTVNQLSHHQ